MSLKSLSNLEIVETARKAYGTRRTRSVAFRTEQLRNLLRLVEENTEEMLLTLKQDMRKSKNEALLFEINYLKIDIKKMIGDLEVFAADDTLPLNLVTPLDNGYLQTEPLGVVLILGAWNYPFLLSIQPMIGAIAAGNVVVLKPSEVALRAAEFMSRRIPEYLDPECYQVIVGDVARTKDLLKHKFDYIFFTGSSSVGTEILAAAALHLTPCTLELGGKSPCYIDDSADFYVAAKRIFWAKCVNLGQTCIAPDYILCSKYAEREFIKTGKEVLLQWYGENPQANPDLPRIINEKHFNRIKKLIDSTTGRIVLGGKTDAKDLWIEPTIIVDVPETDDIMKNEIFGPVFPIITVNSVDEAIEHILARPKPLALYTFAKASEVNHKLMSHVSSGGVCVNDCLWQNAWHGLPLGGVGDSGMGRYHGKFSFDTFSHKKAVLERGFSYVSEKFGEARYPPYTNGKLTIFKFILTNFHRFNLPTQAINNIFYAFCGAMAMFAYFFLLERSSAEFAIPPLNSKQ